MADESETHWMTDQPKNSTEALELLRYGSPFKGVGEQDATRYGVRVINSARVLQNEIESLRKSVMAYAEDDIALDSIACFEGDDSITWRTVIMEWRPLRAQLAEAQKALAGARDAGVLLAGVASAELERREAAEKSLAEAQKRIEIYRACSNTVGMEALHARAESAEREAEALRADLVTLADLVWGDCYERVNHTDEGKYKCRYCELHLENLHQWWKEEHEADCPWRLAAKRSPEAQLQAQADGARK